MSVIIAKIWHLAKELDVLTIANYVLTNEKFEVWSGSSQSYSHHYGKGGLAQHTMEVCELCLLNNKYHRHEGELPLKQEWLGYYIYVMVLVQY